MSKQVYKHGIERNGVLVMFLDEDKEVLGCFDAADVAEADEACKAIEKFVDAKLEEQARRPQ